MDSLPARIRALKQEHRDHGPDDADTCNGNPCICGASAQHARVEAVAREVEQLLTRPVDDRCDCFDRPPLNAAGRCSDCRRPR